MRPIPVNIQPMKLSVRKMRANNLNNFDLSNTPDDVQINADGEKMKEAVDSIQKGIDTATKSVVAEVNRIKSDTAPKPTDTILGMPKVLFYGVVGLLVIGGGLFAYQKYKSKK